MIKLLGPIAAILFAVFMAVVIGAVMYFSFHALMNIFPGDLAGQLFGMALFDVAVIVWFLVFVARCKSTMQYAFSAIGFLIALVGTLGMVAIEVGITSKTLDVVQMAKPMSYIFDLALAAHLVLLYAHHISAPEISLSISLGVDRARIVDDAEKQAERMLEDNQKLLANVIAQEHVRGVLRDLNLQPRDGEVLDLQALDVVPAEAETKKAGAPNFLSWILSGWGKGGRQYQSSVQSAPLSSKPQTPTPSPAVTDAGSGEAADSKPNE